MNTYDQLGIQDYPELLLSTPVATNQGASDLVLSGVPSGRGQSIINGSESSFLIAPGNQITLTTNPLFYVEGSTFECVVYCHAQPTEELAIIADDDSPIGLFANQQGIMLRLVFQGEFMDLPIETTIDVKNWAAKYYITVSFGVDHALLSVNEESKTIDYRYPTITTPETLHIGLTTSTDWFLIDGIGIYKNGFTKKFDLIDDLDNGHKPYSLAAFQGAITDFDTRVEEWSLSVHSSEFMYSGTGDYEYEFLAVQLPQSDLDIEYISLKSTDERIGFEYSYDGGAIWTAFKDRDTIVSPEPVRMLVIRHFVDRSHQENVTFDFHLRITGISDGSIQYRTPARLLLTGGAVYPDLVNDSIVNCPDGTYLDEAYYDGEWIDTPKTIEIVFRPEIEPETGYLEIFQASDGYVRWGPGSHVINGYTAVLNGESVTDTFKVRMGQWNHLTLKKTSNVAAFSINKNLPKHMAIMLLSGYDSELSLSQSQDLYKILYGGDNLTHSEPCGVVTEAVYTETGTAYNLYSYNWAVVGSTTT